MRSLAITALLLASPALAHDEDADDAAELVQAPAASRDGDDVALARQHYKAGLEAFRAARYHKAIDELNQAYEIKPLPLLLVNIGTTYRKMGDHERAALFFKKYLDDAPPDAPDRGEIEAALQQMEKPRGQLEHDVIETAPPDTPVEIHALAPRHDGNVYLYYRRSGVSSFTRVAMRSDGDERVARIPARALAGAAMEYYLEARDKENRVWRRIGEPQKPNVVLVDPEAPARLSAPRKEKPVDNSRLTQMDEELAPLARKPPPPKRRLGGVFYGGLALALIGAGGVALGVAGAVTAQQSASSITQDAAHRPTYTFSDPSAPGGLDDAAFQARGQMWNTIAIAGSAAGGALLGSGLIMMIADAAKKKAPSRKPALMVRDSPSPTDD